MCCILSNDLLISCGFVPCPLYVCCLSLQPCVAILICTVLRFFYIHSNDLRESKSRNRSHIVLTSQALFVIRAISSGCAVTTLLGNLHCSTTYNLLVPRRLPTRWRRINNRTFRPRQHRKMNFAVSFPPCARLPMAIQPTIQQRRLSRLSTLMRATDTSHTLDCIQSQKVLPCNGTLLKQQSLA